MKKLSNIVFCFSLTLLYTISTASWSKTEKVLMLLSSHDTGYWAGEVIDNYQIMTQAGYDIIFATPEGRIGLPAGIYTLNKEQAVTYRQIAKDLSQPHSLINLDSEDYVALYIPGGAGPMFDLYNHAIVNKFIAQMYQSGKPIAAVCHGPAALAGVRLQDGSLMIKGKKVTGKSNLEEGDWAKENYPFLLEDKLIETQAIYSANSPEEAWVVEDGLILTGQNPASTKPLSHRLITLIQNN